MKRTWNPIAAWAHLTSPRRPNQSQTPDRWARDWPAIAQVAVILPVYNQQASIQRTFEAVLQYLTNHPNFTFIFVNDGSSDRTKQILAAGIHIAKTPHIQLLSYTPRAGKGYAIRRGVEYAEGDLICLLDRDRTDSLSDLDRLIAKLQTYDLVIGNRSLAPANPTEPRRDHTVTSKIFQGLSQKILDLSAGEMQAELKGFRKSAAKRLFSRQTLTGGSFDVELIYVAKQWGYTIGEIPVKASANHQKKELTVSSIRDSIKMLLDLLTIRFNAQLGRYH